MKKITCLLLTLAILTCCVFAKTDISYNQPSKEMGEKIIAALENDDCKLYFDLYNETYKPGKKVIDFKSLANINGNYFIEFSTDDEFEIAFEMRLGGCYLYFNGKGYAIYKSETDELLSLVDAYNKGEFSNSDLEEILKHYNDERNSGNIRESYGSIIGDVNRDSIIDIVDLSSLRNAVIKGYNSIQEDMNKDGVVDIADVVIMRNIIVSGK